MKKAIQGVLRSFGYTLARTQPAEISDIKDKLFWELYALCKPYTMTSTERMYALYCAVNYLTKNGIAGDFVECGVWRGGSSMLVASLLEHHQVTHRQIYLFDTFEGMPEPTAHHKDLFGNGAGRLHQKYVQNEDTSTWCLASLEDVQHNMISTGFPIEKCVFVKGKVEDTIPGQVPASGIVLLRLDTDWYASTKHELNHLYRSLAEKGVLIIDDYGHWEGCRKAVDEYCSEHQSQPVLARVDYTYRMAINMS